MGRLQVPVLGTVEEANISYHPSTIEFAQHTKLPQNKTDDESCVDVLLTSLPNTVGNVTAISG